jgi:hypothetical protein
MNTDPLPSLANTEIRPSSIWARRRQVRLHLGDELRNAEGLLACRRSSSFCCAMSAVAAWTSFSADSVCLPGERW